jgi:hypothetical protein
MIFSYGVEKGVPGPRPEFLELRKTRVLRIEEFEDFFFRIYTVLYCTVL